MERLLQQFRIDIGCSVKELKEQQFIFKTGPAMPEMRYWARSEGTIICYNDNLYCRTNNQELTQVLQETYGMGQGEWFGEFKNLRALANILSDFDCQIGHYAPFFIPQSMEFEAINQENLTYYYGNQILQFKDDDRIDQSFCFEKSDPDKIGVAYIENGQMLAMAGANQNGQYIWEMGIEIIDENQGRGIATHLIKALTNKIIELNHGKIIPTYSTQLSHIKSLNVAIRAGLKVGWTELRIDKKII